ncbi:MAG TPA: DUF6714 family protein [Nitrospiraceae bacterium]|nr:DUF6714 family protein [Nitrospiraceae bacterium]
MTDKADVINLIRNAFRATDRPPDAFLQGSHEGCEPFEVVAPFKGRLWQEVEASVLDANYTALGFFSEGGFRYFLPAFLIADLEGRLQTADPVFHLTHGFSDHTVMLEAGSRIHEKRIGKSQLVNPRRYGAMTWHDHVRCRLSVFTREEARAIVAYLEYRRDRDTDGLTTEEIDAALDAFWRDRVAGAPTQNDLRESVEAEQRYLQDIQAEGGADNPQGLSEA